MNRQPPPNYGEKMANSKDVTPAARIILLVVGGIVLILMAVWWRVM